MENKARHSPSHTWCQSTEMTRTGCLPLEVSSILMGGRERGREAGGRCVSLLKPRGTSSLQEKSNRKTTRPAPPSFSYCPVTSQRQFRLAWSQAGLEDL